MAILSISASDAQTVKHWSKMLYVETIGYTRLFKRLLGTSKDSILYWAKDLEKMAGDQIKYDLLLDLVDPGKSGSDLIERNTEAMNYKQDSILIDQHRFGTSWDHMSEQRSLHDFRSDSKFSLKKRFSTWLESSTFRCLCGDTTYNFAGNTGTNPDAAHYYVCGDAGNSGVWATDSQAISNNDQITLQDLDYAREKALENNNALRPVTIDGKDHFVVILHPFVMNDLRNNVAASTDVTWMDIQQNANMRGETKNPIFTGAHGVYRDMILWESPYIITAASTTNCYVNLLLGAQAATYATGSPHSVLQKKAYGNDLMMNWSEESWDHSDKIEVVAGTVCGFKKNRFANVSGTQTDYGTMQILSYSASHES
jgi:N4-gp56 family major capsid protein